MWLSFGACGFEWWVIDGVDIAQQMGQASTLRRQLSQLFVHSNPRISRHMHPATQLDVTGAARFLRIRQGLPEPLALEVHQNRISGMNARMRFGVQGTSWPYGSCQELNLRE